MKCEIRTGACWGEGVCYVYRHGGRYRACQACFDAVEKPEAKEERPAILPAIPLPVSYLELDVSQRSNGHG